MSVQCQEAGSRPALDVSIGQLGPATAQQRQQHRDPLVGSHPGIRPNPMSERAMSDAHPIAASKSRRRRRQFDQAANLASSELGDHRIRNDRRRK